MTKDRNEITKLKPKEELNMVAVGIVGAVAGAVASLAITALMEKNGTKKIEEAAEDVTTQGVKIIRSFRRIVEELDNLRDTSSKTLENGKKDVDKFIRG